MSRPPNKETEAPTAKVYLSSTLLGLREERQAVSDWLIAAGFQPVRSYVADSETVRDSCFDDIAGCDLYVLLLGHHYGFQPSKHNPKKASITQLDFRHAGKLRLTRLAFLRSCVPDIHHRPQRPRRAIPWSWPSAMRSPQPCAQRNSRTRPNSWPPATRPMRSGRRIRR